ncbi:hypothetical protein SAMN04515674_11444 [Pseudarcicella hirudinis]|uniref:Outer membrane protein beta-barrel domain-containing protein n=1 Tax=Pseudarcicella hirudinis TaxID=1079859 RepID=A0A1I5XB26_9BACT|nr:hypothetical protein [Pseudarcicella hirudinis]SFQ29179.1 hypothetical protein SAMN04515674_11444 [Pseudarcicella hirudinis]
MKKLLFFIFLATASFTKIYAQDPVVIKQEGATGDLDEEPDVRDLPFRQRIRIGGGVSGLSFGNPTSIGISPMVGYQATNETIVGLGLTYQYYSIKDIYGNRYSNNLLGERIFARRYLPFLQQLVGQGYLVGQVENYSSLSDSGPYTFSYSNPILIGVGIGSKIGLNIQVMYDLNYPSANSFKTSPYGSALVIQIGGFFF